jgi:RNA polymerase sigma-70 factor (ECF subfamily)
MIFGASQGATAYESGIGGSGATAAPPRAWESLLEEPFSAFVAAHRTRALRLAWRLVGGDSDAAEDVTQDAFVKAYRSLDGFRGDAKLETWFYRILVRQASNYRRWRAVRDRFDGLFRDEDAQIPDPRPRAVGDPALRRRIGEALDQLTRKQREAFVLVHMEGFSVREAASVMGSAEGTLKSHLHRALVQLREQLGDVRAPNPDTVPREMSAEGAGR